MQKNTIILLFFILLKMFLHFFLIHPDYDLQRDEYLHLDQGRHLAWGYESVPPFSAWVALIIRWLGNGVFWVKFFPALFGALTMVVVWKTIEALKGGMYALVLGAVAVTFSVIMRLNILFQPNSFDVLCWTFLYFTFLKFIITENRKWLMLGAACFALGFLNKYNIAFLVMGLVPAILITEHRTIFINKYFYYAAGLGLLLISPNLLWQYQHNFPVIHHMKELSETQLVNVNRLDFLKEQLLFFIGSLFILVAAFVAFVVHPLFKQFRVFGWLFLFTMLIFIFFKAKPYYAIGLYPFLLPFGAVYLEQILKNGWKVYLRPLAFLLILGSFIPLYKIAFPVQSPSAIKANGALLKKLGLLRWEDGKDHALPQDFADMQGWRELANKTDSIYETLNDAAHTLVLCDNYGQAGAINYYSKHPDIHAVSMNADYINWFPLTTKEIKHVILVQEINDDDKNRTREKQFFKTVLLTGTIENPYAREQGTNIYLLKDATTSINKILEQEIRDRKSKQ